MTMDDQERAAGGMDFDDASDSHNLGATLFAEGPDAFLEQLEEMIPETWREQITNYPLTAVAIGFGIGLYLGMKKGDEVITAGSAMLSAAATASMGDILSNLGGD